MTTRTCALLVDEENYTQGDKYGDSQSKRGDNLNDLSPTVPLAKCDVGKKGEAKEGAKHEASQVSKVVDPRQTADQEQQQGENDQFNDAF